MTAPGRSPLQTAVKLATDRRQTSARLHRSRGGRRINLAPRLDRRVRTMMLKPGIAFAGQ